MMRYLLAAFLLLLAAPAAFAGCYDTDVPPGLIRGGNCLYFLTVNSDGSINAAIGPSSASTSGIAPVVSASAESNHVLKSSAGNLYGVCVTNGATAGYMMFFNATSAPADGAVTPVGWVAAPGVNTTYCYDPGAVPDYYSTGITVVYSSTGPFTKTASATAAFSGKVQ